MDRKGEVALDEAWRYKTDLSGAPIGFLLWRRVFEEDKFFLEQATSYPRADLSMCDLRGADFSMVAGGFDFRGAYFGLANFYEAKLTGADLSKANFVGTNLESADLTGATVDQARLESAKLVGTNLTATSPWRAYLYEQYAPSKPVIGTTRKSIRSVSDLIATCSELSAMECPDRGALRLYYRGEAKKWKLRPSVMRSRRYRNEEGRMLLDLMTRRPGEFEGTKSALSQWVLAQHHGLKTRLLDVTKNPLVAMFNVCEDTSFFHENGRLHVFGVPASIIRPYNSDAVSVIANFAKLSRSEQSVLLGKRRGIEDAYSEVLGKLYHLIGEEKPHFQRRIDARDLFRVFLVEPQLSVERLNVQSGAFLFSAFHERFERDFVSRWNGGIPIYDHVILEVPRDDKPAMMKELKLLNVTRERLFPSLDESAKSIEAEISAMTGNGDTTVLRNRTWRDDHNYVELPRVEMPPDPWLARIPPAPMGLPEAEVPSES